MENEFLMIIYSSRKRPLSHEDSIQYLKVKDDRQKVKLEGCSVGRDKEHQGDVSLSI